MDSIGAELSIFLYAGLTGVILASAYRLLICVRHVIPHSGLAAGLEDIVFMAAAGTYLFRQMYFVTFGQIRWYFVLGSVLGILIIEGIFWLLRRAKTRKEPKNKENI